MLGALKVPPGAIDLHRSGTRRYVVSNQAITGIVPGRHRTQGDSGWKALLADSLSTRPGRAQAPVDPANTRPDGQRQPKTGKSRALPSAVA